jgi:hypothetical protein
MGGKWFSRGVVAGAVFLSLSMTFGGATSSASAPVWTAVEAPAPSAALASFDFSVSTVSCPTPTACFAVGGYKDLDGHQQGLVERLTQGKWTVSEAPVPSNAASNPDMSFSALACPSAGFCTAVGSYGTTGGAVSGLIEDFARGRWTALEAPQPGPGSSDGQNGLVSVDCPSAHACTAVGDYTDSFGDFQGLIDGWNGKNWSAVAAPMPPRAAGSPADLYVVSCATTPSCVAVGGYEDSSDNLQGVIDTESNGSWVAAPAPLPSGAASDPKPYLDALSCSRSTCAAIGTYQAAGDAEEGVLDVDAQGSWTATEAPLPSDADTNFPLVELRSVDCPSPQSCTAVGSYDGSSGTEDLIETLSKGAWTESQGSLPANSTGPNSTDQSLLSVVCASARSCLVVGTYSGPAGTMQAASETLARRTWTATEIPPAEGSELNAVGAVGPLSCASQFRCAMVIDHDSGGDGLIDQLAEGAWTTTPRLLPDNAQGFEASLDSVSCPTEGSCMAVGLFDNMARAALPVIDTLSDGTWTSMAGAVWTGDPRLMVESFGPASCGSASECAVLGTSEDDGDPSPFVDSLSAGTWSSSITGSPGDSRETDASDVACGPSVCEVVGGYSVMGFNFGRGFINGADAPLPSNAPELGSSSVASVSCPADGSCTAVGGYEDSSGDDQGLIVTTTGSGQTTQEAAAPTGTAANPEISLDSVECSSVSSCMAVGSFQNSADQTEGLIETLAQGTWSATVAPVPADANTGNPDVLLASIDCGPSGICVALGQYKNTGGVIQTFVESLANGKWTADSLPVPSDAGTGGTPTFSSAGCSSTGTCYVVGTYGSTAGTTEGLIDTETSGSWSAAAGPLPANAGTVPGASIDSISCPSDGGCVAVGQYTDSSGVTDGFIASVS